jgi:hypothetical protein
LVFMFLNAAGTSHLSLQGSALIYVCWPKVFLCKMSATYTSNKWQFLSMWSQSLQIMP